MFEYKFENNTKIFIKIHITRYFKHKDVNNIKFTKKKVRVPILNSKRPTQCVLRA